MEIKSNGKSGRIGQQALVIGGSISGLLAARVLSDHYDKVLVIERDDLTFDNNPRRGVPQGRHAHGLLAGGTRVLEEFFPDIMRDLLEAGAGTADSLDNTRWFFEGGCFRQAPSGTIGVLASRPLLENVIRKRVLSIANVEMHDDLAVNELVHEGWRVVGIRTDKRVIAADLVVDAAGRGSRTPQWLTSMGFNPAPEEKVEVQLAYTTRRFRRRRADLAGDVVAVIPPTPDGKRGGVMAEQEGEQWIVTLFGHFGIQAPTDLQGFINYARSLPAPYIYDVIRNAEPIDEPAVTRFPASMRRRYEKLRKFPKGFLVFGDSICSFNPIYGQGMTSAAMQAVELHNELLSGSQNLATRFFKKAAKVIDNPWNIAVGGDLRMPETLGRRSLGVKLINWYISKLHRCAHNDEKAAIAFLRVAQLLDPPKALLHPAMVWRVLSADILGRLGIIDTVNTQEITSG